MLGVQFEHTLTKKRHRVWFESPVLGRPVKDDATGVADKRLFPRDCREAVSSLVLCIYLQLAFNKQSYKERWHVQCRGSDRVQQEVTAVISKCRQACLPCNMVRNERACSHLHLTHTCITSASCVWSLTVAILPRYCKQPLCNVRRCTPHQQPLAACCFKHTAAARVHTCV